MAKYVIFGYNSCDEHSEGGLSDIYGFSSELQGWHPPDYYEAWEAVDTETGECYEYQYGKWTLLINEVIKDKAGLEDVPEREDRAVAMERRRTVMHLIMGFEKGDKE